MSSIMTNAAAMTALQTLRATNKSLDVTQNRISTGFRVAEAAHNAAYWSIATTMRSDNKAMSTVQDALGLGAAQVDIAYTAMDAVKDTLDEIKAKLVAASEPDIDKKKIQEEIVQLKQDLRTYAKSATFSGGNWLDVTETSVEKVVASFIRDSEGSITLGTIDVDTSKTALFNSDADTFGLLQGEGNYQLGGLSAGTPVVSVWDTDAANSTNPSISLGEFDGLTLAEGDEISFQMSFDGETHRIVLEYADAGANGVFTVADLRTALAGKINTAFTGTFTVVGSGNEIVVTGPNLASAADEGKSIGISGLAAIPGQLDILSIDITDASTEELAGLINGVDKAFSAVTTAASDLGAIKTRIASQQIFVSKIMDAVDRGVGQLVDADMSEESTRLQALQVQQQLGIQALSIANANAQNILSLFR